jgi:hypothetical protein
MKPVAAFAVGLWTGALVMAGVGLVSWRLLERPAASGAPQSLEQLAQQLQLLQQQQAKAAAEAARLRQTVAELRAAAAENNRPVRARETAAAPGVAPWIVETVLEPDEHAFARLAKAAATDLNALDGLALLAEHDNAETLTRVWESKTLTASGKVRAATLLAATVEVNPRAADVLAGMAGDGVLVEAALTGLLQPDFPTRLARGTGIVPPPHFQPDYALRLRLLDHLRQAVTDETIGPAFEQVRQKLTERLGAPVAN